MILGNGESDASSWSRSDAVSGGDSNTWTESESETDTPVLIPVMGKELSHVQFRSLDEQLFRSMAVLFDQKQRQGVARLVGMSAPVSLYTPEVEKTPGSAERTKKYVETCCQKLSFALPSAEAQKQLAARAENLPDILIKELADAPETTKRRLR